MPETGRDPTRPSPDALLEAARREERTRGRLKVFLGAAPGVGKTYEMLTIGRARLKAGADVVIGVVETHGRAETEALLVVAMASQPTRQAEAQALLQQLAAAADRLGDRAPDVSRGDDVNLVRTGGRAGSRVWPGVGAACHCQSTGAESGNGQKMSMHV